jgi:hypothetical protein
VIGLLPAESGSVNIFRIVFQPGGFAMSLKRVSSLLLIVFHCVFMLPPMCGMGW